MIPLRLLLVPVLLTALSGCVRAPVPGVSPDLLAARADAAPGRPGSASSSPSSIDLMRRQGERFAGVPFLPSRVELLVDGPATFAAMADAIRSATRRIDMESYEFDEEAGRRFADLLLAARARGVEVNLVYDAWGSLGTPAALFDRLRAGGVRVLEYNPLGPNPRVPVDLNRRDHRKLLCIDGRLCVTGGVNISRVYRNAPAPQGAAGSADPDRGVDPERQAWRDTDVRIEGPVAAQFERYFMETWREQRGPALAEPPPAPLALPAGAGLDTPGYALVQAIDGAPGDGQPLIYRTLLASIALARRSVHLTTGFFVPTPDMTEALTAAARRGVDVQLVVPSLSDSTEAVWAGRASYGKLLEAGVRIHERLGRVLHAKTAVIDGAWSAVGSSNLDWRSTVWNNEIDAIVLGDGFGRQMEALFQADLAASHTIDLAAWRRRGPVQRFQELKASLLQDLL